MEGDMKTILIIDDVKTILKYFQVVLQRLGFSVLLADNGSEGLALFRSHSQQIGLILLDLQMPDMTGFDIARTIRKTHPDIPIIAQTALSMAENKTKAFEAGCTDILLKPIDMDQLKEMVNRYMGE